MPASPSKLLFLSGLSFIAGIFFGNFFVAPHLAVFVVFLILLFLIFILLIKVKDPINTAPPFQGGGRGGLPLFMEKLDKSFLVSSWSGKKYIISYQLLIIICFFILGFWRLNVAWPDYADGSKLTGYASSTVEFTGQIVKIDQTIDSQKLTVKADYLIGASVPTNQKFSSRPVSGRVAVKTGLYPKWQLGEKVKINCELSRPGMIEDFDYAKYLRPNKIFVFCALAEVAPISDPPFYSLWGNIGRLKSWLAQGINTSLPEPQASVIKGIVLGDSRGIPEHYNTVFANLGLTHIIAVSGSHLVVVFALVFGLLLALGIRRQKTFWPAAAIIAAYVLMVGAPASAVRSAIMILAALYAVTLGRLTAIKNILVFTAALMLAINPFTLVDDIGFQLSFISVMGLAYLLPILQYHAKKWQKWPALKEIILVTLSAQIATLPLIVYYFGRVSLLSLPANLLILPIIPPLMIGGAVTAVLGAVFPFLGRILGWLVWLAVQYWLMVSDFIHSLPLSSVALTDFGWPALLLSYIFLVWFVWRQRKKYSI